MVTLVHFDRLCAEREREHLMPQTNAEKRHVGVDKLLNDGNRIFTCRSGVARPI